MAYYLHTSALVKLVLPEPESEALRRWIETTEDVLVTSDLARTELLRAVRRVRPEVAPMARTVLDSLTLLRLGTGVFEEAARLDLPSLRSLDALHLAAALTLGGSVRVGLEDNLYLPDGTMARSNGDLVAKARQLTLDVGRRPATVAEARALLGVPARPAADRPGEALRA